jgi:nucleoside-diphosphate-sugar epimerase
VSAYRRDCGLRGLQFVVPCVMRRSILIAGCGFVGLPLARNFVDAGWETHAITGSESSAERLRSEPFHVCSLDIRNRKAVRQMARHSFDVVVHCASSGRGNARDYEAIFLEGAKNLLSRLEYGRFIFTGSTSVYAQTDGSWVDETSQAEPTRETGRVLRKTEELVLSAGGIVTRLAGLYGPGRCVPLQKLLEGEAIIEGNGSRRMNLVHYSDAATALQFLAQSETAGIYNVVDNLPVTQVDWYRYVCDLLNRPLPPTGSPDLNRKRGWTDKCVSNQKLRSLGWEPIYATFKEGVRSLVGSEQK